MDKCMDVWMAPFPHSEWAKLPSIHPYASSINCFFDVVWRFCLETWPWLWKLKFRFFKKTSIFRVCMYISPFRMVIKTKTFSFEMSKKLETAIVVYVCMYVCLYAHKNWANGNIHPYASSINLFDVFWRVCLKTWPWLWKLRFRFFKKALIFFVGCIISPFRMVIKT